MSRSPELQFAAHVVAPGTHLGVAQAAVGVRGATRSIPQQPLGVDSFLLPLYFSRQGKGIELLMTLA